MDPIVSLHKLCQVGYRVDWTRDGGCRVSAPGRAALRVYMDGGCPEVDKQVGLALIQEIETFQVRNAGAVRSLRSWGKKGEHQVTLGEALKALPVDPSPAMQWLSKKFPSLPVEVLARIPVASSYDTSRVAWNRRQRRTWARSKALALHLFSGPQKRFWELPCQDARCVCVDVQENLLDDHTFAFLQSMALQGQLCAVFGGPPCRTFSLSRYMPPELPRPLRGRTLASQWGFDHLTPSEREMVLTDGILMFRMVWLYLIAEAVAAELHRPTPFFGMENPKDPETWACPEDLGFQVPDGGLASCWALEAIKDFAADHELYFWHLDQGPLGHEKRKPTAILSSIPPPPDVQVSGPGHGFCAERTSPNSWPSSAWAAWAPGLKAIIKREVLSTVDAWSSEKCNALREQENFLRHVVQGHVDFRRDCAACLAGAARGSRHNRKSVHDAWVLNVDLMGPFSEGADEHGKVKYVLTGILTVPDFSCVTDAVRESDDIAAGSKDAPSVDPEAPGLPAGVRDTVPLSSLGPQPSRVCSPIPESDLEEYEPSENGEDEDVLTLQPDEAVLPETEAEAAAVERANRRWQEAALALQLWECPVLEIPLLRMLPDKSQQTVSQGLAAMLAHLRYEGFMVRRLHSDRGREFNNGVVQRLCRQRELHQTFTQGDDPQQNGRVESYHARLKGKTRTLLRAASAAASDWPYAMRAAQAAMWAHAVAKLGKTGWQPLPFGTHVKVRTRSWERFGDVWSDRVQDAMVLAPSIETRKGHVVRALQGTLLHTTALFRGAVQPTLRPAVPPEVVLPAQTREAPTALSGAVGPEVAVSFPSSSVPSLRVTGKQSPTGLKAVQVAPTSRADVQAVSAAAAALLTLRPVPFRTSAALLVSAPVLRDLARALPARLGAGESSAYLMFGWFKHGGRWPDWCYLRDQPPAWRAHPSGTWTTLGLFFAAVAGPHVDRRNAKSTFNYVLPLALPPTEQYIWVTNALGAALAPLAYLCNDGAVHQGFRLPLRVGEPVCVDPHSLHALPSPLPHESTFDHVLLVGFTVPRLHRATAEQHDLLHSLGFRLGLSRGGVSGAGIESTEEKVFAATFDQKGDAQELGQGLLEACLSVEGHQQLEREAGERTWDPSDLRQDVQEDTAAEGSVSFRGAYARRLETRNFEPADWDQVQNYLTNLGLKHLIGPIDALGVDSLEDFGFLYREGLMEAGASKEEAEAVLSCTGSAQEGRPEPPPVARSGYSRPSRPAAPLRLAEAARIVRAPDRADRVRQDQGHRDTAAEFPGLQGHLGTVVSSQGLQGADAMVPGVQSSLPVPLLLIHQTQDAIVEPQVPLGTSAEAPDLREVVGLQGQCALLDESVARSGDGDSAGAQGEAHVEEVVVDPWGRILPQGEANILSASGVPLGMTAHVLAGVNGSQMPGTLTPKTEMCDCFPVNL